MISTEKDNSISIQVDDVDTPAVAEELVLVVENENHETEEIHVPVFKENLKRKYKDVVFAILFLIVFIGLSIYGTVTVGIVDLSVVVYSKPLS
jgi:hypothetical protein